MPEKAKVFVAEDNPDHLEWIIRMVETAGHTVTLTARSLNDALAAINTFSEAGIQIASIDGNLGSIGNFGSDGDQMVTAIRKVAPDVKIIGMASSTISGVDVDLGKKRLSELGQVITKL